MPRSSPFGCLIAFFGFLLFAATATAGTAAWLAYLRPEKGIEWQPLAWLAAGFLAISVLMVGFAWYRINNSSPD